MCKVLLADPTHSVRAAFSLLLRRRLHVGEIAEAADLEHLNQVLALFQPDLLVLDWRLLAANDQALRHWQRRQPGLKIVAMSVQPEDALAAAGAGADGFIDKSAPPEQALDSLRRCLDGAAPALP